MNVSQGAANCAGIIGKHHGTKNIAELEDDEWNKIIAVNLTGMMYCLRAEINKISDFGSSKLCVASGVFCLTYASCQHL